MYIYVYSSNLLLIINHYHLHPLHLIIIHPIHPLLIILLLSIILHLLLTSHHLNLLIFPISNVILSPYHSLISPYSLYSHHSPLLIHPSHLLSLFSISNNHHNHSNELINSHSYNYPYYNPIILSNSHYLTLSY